MRITSTGISQMNAETSMTPQFKGEMGHVYRVLYPKQFVNPFVLDENGEPTLEDDVTGCAKRLELEKIKKTLSETGFTGIYLDIELMNQNKILSEKGLAPDVLAVELEKIKQTLSTYKLEGKVLEDTAARIVEQLPYSYLVENYNQYTDFYAFGKKTRGIDTGKDGYRGKVASQGYTDEKGIYHKDLLDEYSAVVSAIFKAKEAEIDANATLTPDQKKFIKEGQKKTKPIKAVRPRIAMEVLAMEADIEGNLKAGTKMNTNSLLYVCSVDHFNKMKLYLHDASIDKNLDYLELTVVYETYQEATEELSKMKSAKECKMKGPTANNAVAALDETFISRYREYRANAMMDVIETKVRDFKPMEDSKIHSIMKPWIATNMNYLTPDEKEKFKGVLSACMKSLTLEEVKSIAKDEGAVNTQTTNTVGMGMQTPTGGVVQQNPQATVQQGALAGVNVAQNSPVFNVDYDSVI